MTVGAERLMVLRSALRSKKLPEPLTKFDMSQWYEQTTCGTSACAGGLAALLPRLQEEGLRLSQFFGSRCIPRFKEFGGYRALAEFFNLSSKEAEFIFSPMRYKGRALMGGVSPRTVENHINEVLFGKPLRSRLVELTTGKTYARFRTKKEATVALNNMVEEERIHFKVVSR